MGPAHVTCPGPLHRSLWPEGSSFCLDEAGAGRSTQKAEAESQRDLVAQSGEG